MQPTYFCQLDCPPRRREQSPSPDEKRDGRRRLADASGPLHRPAAAGSAGDDVCRLVAAKLGDRFGQQFVIVNQPAAGGTLGIQDHARAAPDGYTIGQISTSTQVIAKLYNPALWYDGLKDFAPISLLGNSPYVLAVYPGLAVKNVAELVELAKRQPLNNGAFGTTSLGYLASKLFEREAGIRLNQVPYRSSAQAVIDVVAGRVEMQFSTLPPAIPLIRTGKLHRSPLPERSGLQHLPMCRHWRNPVSPDSTSHCGWRWPHRQARRRRSSPSSTSELVSLLNGAEMRDAMLRQSFVAESSSPDALAERIRADLAKWRDVVASAGTAKN